MRRLVSILAGALCLTAILAALAVSLLPRGVPSPDAVVRTSPEAIKATYSGSKAEWVAIHPALRGVQVAQVCGVGERRGARLADAVDSRFAVGVLARLRETCG